MGDYERNEVSLLYLLEANINTWNHRNAMYLRLRFEPVLENNIRFIQSLGD